MRPMIRQNIGMLCAIGAALLFSLKPILVKLIYAYDLGTLTVLAWRMLISIPIYIGIGMVILKRRSINAPAAPFERRLIVKSMAVGLLGYYLASVLDLQGLQTITTQLERLILYSFPTWVAILSWLILKTPLNKRVLLALSLSYLGIAVIFVSDWQQLGQGIWVGSAWVLLSALVFALYVVFSKPLIDQLGANEFTVVAMLSSSTIALLHFFAIERVDSLIVPLPAFYLLILMALFTTVFPTFLLAAAIARIGPTRTAIGGTFGPVMTSIFAVILLDEYFGWPQVFGLIFVISAISLLQFRRRTT